MAEQKGGTDDGEESHGEFVGLRNVDDSGIESGEDLRAVNPEVMREVEDVLGKLEGVIVGLDPSRRVAVTQLVSSLQSCLRLPPKRRLTVGVSAEELAAARTWFQPSLEEMTLEQIVYRPVVQRVGILMEPAPLNAILSYVGETERSLSGDSGSLRDYDPSLILFTPEQTVKIAIHKAAINKQISQEEKRRESSDDGDVSSGEDENLEVNKYNEVSSAQRLLQLATDSAKKNPSAARFHNRSNRKLKMKRANTIDIPKSSHFYEYSSDEYGASADEVNTGFERRRTSNEMAFLPPAFEPKTENDMKFLAFLKQVNDNQPKMQAYNPSARGGKHWSNRFSSIKTAFEHVDQKSPSAAPSPAKMFWQNAEAGRSKSRTDQPSKLPWTVKTENDGVVVGSLTVSKPGHVNNFNHASKSAFKPIEKKPTSTVSGTVKQIAAQKFSVADDEFINKPIEKSVKKVISSSNAYSNTPTPKQNGSYSALKPYTPNPVLNKYSENINSGPKNHSSYTNIYNGTKSYKSSDQSVNKDFSKLTNGTQNKYSDISQNKLKSPNTNSNYNSTAPNYKSYTNNDNNNQDYLSKTQQNTLVAKKQFMESDEKLTPKKTLTDSNKIETPKENFRQPNSYHIERPDTNSVQCNVNGTTRNTHNFNHYGSSYEFDNQTPHTQNHNKYSHVNATNENKYSKTNIVQPLPVSLGNSHNSFSNSEKYVMRSESEATMTSKSTTKNAQNTNTSSGAGIIEPLIIPKEKISINSKVYENNVSRHYLNTSFVDPPFIPRGNVPLDFQSNDIQSPTVHTRTLEENTRLNFNIPSPRPVQPTLTPRGSIPSDLLTSSVQPPIITSRPVEGNIPNNLQISSQYPVEKHSPIHRASLPSNLQLQSYNSQSPIQHSMHAEDNLASETYISSQYHNQPSPQISQGNKLPSDMPSYSVNPQPLENNIPLKIPSPPYYPQEPSPPIRRDSLPKNYQNFEPYPKTLMEPYPIIRDNVYSPPDAYCDNHLNNYTQDCSNRLIDNNYPPSPAYDKQPYTTYIRSSNSTLNSTASQDSMPEISNTHTSQSNYLSPLVIPTPPLVKEEPPTPPSNFGTPDSLDRLSPNKQNGNNNPSKSQLDPRYLSPSSHQSVSPSLRYEDDDNAWGNVPNGDDNPLEEKAVSRVMGQAQCQQAVTVNNRTKRRFDIDLESELKLQLKQSVQKKSLSPSFPNVIQKSESWHQMVKEQMQQAKQAPPLPKISKAKSSHALAHPKQFEAALAPDSVTQKKITVSQYLAKQQTRSIKSTKSNPKYKSTNTLYIDHDDDDLDNVDEVFESIFQETTRKRNSK